MKYVSPGKHRDVASMRAHLDEVARALGRPGALGCDAVLDGPDGPLAQPLEVDGLVVGNRFCVHPMEGWDGTPAGGPSELTLRRWRRFGMSGAKLVWGGEAFAVQPDGRANPNQLCAFPGRDVAADLAQLRRELLAGHADATGGREGLVVGLQLTHSGRYSRPTETGPAPRCAWRHPVLDARMGLDPAANPAHEPLTDGELETIGERYVALARLAHEVGFDFVDVKCCHGYLLHELLGARERPGTYGGELGGRARLLLRIVDELRKEVPALRIGTRMSVADVAVHGARVADGVGEPTGRSYGEPPRYGFGVDALDPAALALDESITVLGWLRERGVKLVNVSIGSPYTCPHLQRPAAYPPVDGYLPPEDPLASVARHLLAVADLRRALPGMAFVGTGYSYLQEWLPHVAQHEVRAEHVDFVGLGRLVLSYPGLPLDVLAGRPLERRLLCRTFSDCTNAPRNGMVSGCYPLDPYYKARPERAALEDQKRAARAAQHPLAIMNDDELGADHGERWRSGLRMSHPPDPARLEEERRTLVTLDEASFATRTLAYFRMAGPGYLQSAMTLGGGTAAASLFAGAAFGYSLLWVAPLAMLMGVVMLSAVSYQTLSTGLRPFEAMRRYAGAPFAWTWALGALAASIIWHFPQYSLASAVLVDVADVAGLKDVPPFGASVFVLVWAVLLSSLYGRSTRAIRVYENALKLMVWSVVLCFGLVVWKTGVGDWGALLRGFIAFEIPGERNGVSGVTTVLSGLSAAVGINMLFLYPYTLLAKGWGREHRRLARFDLLTGMFLPYFLATTLMVIAMANTVYLQPDFEGTRLGAQDAAIVLADLFGDAWGRVVFNLGVLAMALSTITLHMLCAGFIGVELFNLKVGSMKHRLFTLLPAPGVLGPLVWSDVAVWIAVPTNIVCGFFLPLAYIGFVRLQRSKTYLGDDLPRGGKAMAWLGAMVAITIFLIVFLGWFAITRGPAYFDTLFG